MNLDKAEQFLKDKGLDTEKYRIKDVNGGYLPQIPIALWLTEFAEQVKNNDSLHSVMPCVKDSVKQLLEETNEAYKEHRKNGMESTALTSEAMSYAYQIVLNIIDRHEA